MRDNRWRDDDSRIRDEDQSGPGGRGYGQRSRNDQDRYRDADRVGASGRSGYGSDYERDRGGQYGQGRYDQDPDFGRRSIGGYGAGGYGQNAGQGGFGGNAWSDDRDGGYARDRGGYGRGQGYGYGDYDRSSEYGASNGRGNAGYGAPDYGYSGGRGYRAGYGNREGQGRDWRSDRNWFDRATDEVASWMGDDDAERRRDLDRAEDHRGRGPRGYTRSDDRIREDVSDRLTDDYRVNAADVEVTVSNGEVTLNGTVRSRDEKRRAEDVAEAVSGVKHVQNNLRVSQGGSEGNRSFSSDAGSGIGTNAGTGETGSGTPSAASKTVATGTAVRSPN